jgi:hypothetical protein
MNFNTFIRFKQHVHQNDHLLREKNNHCIILDNYRFVISLYNNILY